MKKGRDLFSVAMTAYDGVEQSKLVGTFLSGNKKEIRFYRDDSLLVFRNKSRAQLEKNTKQITKIVKKR